MEETQKFKEDLHNLADNLNESEGVILLTGINSGNSKTLNAVYHKVNYQFAIPALLSTLADVYESVLDSYKHAIKEGNLLEDEVKELNSITDGMFKTFNLIQKDLAENSYIKRIQVIKNSEKEN